MLIVSASRMRKSIKDSGKDGKTARPASSNKGTSPRVVVSVNRVLKAVVKRAGQRGNGHEVNDFDLPGGQSERRTVGQKGLSSQDVQSGLPALEPTLVPDNHSDSHALRM